MIASLTSMLYQDAPNVIAEKLTGTSYTNPKVVDFEVSEPNSVEPPVTSSVEDVGIAAPVVKLYPSV